MIKRIINLLSSSCYYNPNKLIDLDVIKAPNHRKLDDKKPYSMFVPYELKIGELFYCWNYIKNGGKVFRMTKDKCMKKMFLPWEEKGFLFKNNVLGKFYLEN